MIYFYCIFSSLTIILLLMHLRRNDIFVENLTDISRKIHTTKISRIGGTSLLSIAIIFFYTNNIFIHSIVIFASLFFVVGLFSDLGQKDRLTIRTLLISFLIIIFIFIYDVRLINFDQEILDKILLSNIYINYIFVFFCYLFLTNGFNFIDGNDGLVLGISLIILINFIFYTEGNDHDLQKLMLCLIFAIIPLFLFNFVSGKIINGDAGSYFLGFIIGSIAIYIANSNLIYATLIACIVSYPINELVVSVLRRIIILRKNPLLADRYHLHSILYSFLEKKIGNIKFQKLNININALTSIIILTYFSLCCLAIYSIGEFIGYLTSFITLLFLHSFFNYILYVNVYRK